MSDSELKKLEARIKALETKNSTPEVVKKSRKKSDYNVFVQDYIAGEKKKGTTKSHRELFGDAAKAWTANKK
jgi:hypothetical protein